MLRVSALVVSTYLIQNSASVEEFNITFIFLSLSLLFLYNWICCLLFARVFLTALYYSTSFFSFTQKYCRSSYGVLAMHVLQCWLAMAMSVTEPTKAAAGGASKYWIPLTEDS